MPPLMHSSEYLKLMCSTLLHVGKHVKNKIFPLSRFCRTYFKQVQGEMLSYIMSFLILAENT